MFFFFNDTATTEIYTLSLHDALPIYASDINAFALPGGPMYVNRGMIEAARSEGEMAGVMAHEISHVALRQDRKSTRLNSSHANISYAVFCLKKKTTNKQTSDDQHYIA